MTLRITRRTTARGRCALSVAADTRVYHNNNNSSTYTHNDATNKQKNNEKRLVVESRVKRDDVFVSLCARVVIITIIIISESRVI